MQKRKRKTVAENGSNPTVQEMRLCIRYAWEKGAFRQEEAAEHLSVDQGQISKIVNGYFKRPKGNAARLFEYAKTRLAEIRESDGAQDSDVTQAVRNELVDSVLSAWDGSEEGADALIEILNGVRQLQERGRTRSSRSS